MLVAWYILNSGVRYRTIDIFFYLPAATSDHFGVSYLPMTTSPYMAAWFTDVYVAADGERFKERRVKCNLCSKVICKKLERLLSHLGYERPTGRLNSVTLCTQLNPSVRDLFRRCGGQFPPHNGEMSGAHSRPSSLESPFVGTPRSTVGSSCEEFFQASPSTSTTPLFGLTPVAPNVMNPIRVGGNVSRSMKQSMIEDGFAEAERRELDVMWAKYFYEANIPFATARNPAFKAAVMKTASFKRPYVPPSYHDIRTKLLEHVKGELAGKLDDRLNASIRRFGGTLALDGWSSVNSRPLVNAMLVTPAGELFLGAVDTTGKEKTAEYMASIMVKFIKQVGPENVVQVCTDNASVMLNAMRLVQEEYPHIFIQGCATHAMDLLMEDMGKAPWVKEVLDKAKNLVKFIKNRQMPLAVFRKHEARFSLLMPGKTRFACNFIMIDRLLEVRESLEQTVVDPQYLAYANKKSLSARDKQLLSRTVRRVVLDESFWTRCQNFRDMVAPVVYALREFDGKQPSTGKALCIARNLSKHVLALSNPPFSLPADLARTVKDNFAARTKMMTTDLMCAAALLNPYLQKEVELMDDPDLWAGCRRVLEILCPNESTYNAAVKEYMDFSMRDGVFANLRDPDQSTCSPHVWWQTEGYVGKIIAPIAKRILAQTVSSSACERNWSSYSFVHDKKRNRLLPERAEALVFVYTNSKLLAKAKLTDEKRWYEVNLEAEDHDVPDSDEAESSHHSVGSALPECDPVDLDDDLNSSPSMSLQDGWKSPNHAFDFGEEGGDQEADEVVLAQMIRSRKTNGDVNCDDIPDPGLTPITDETVVPPEKRTGSDTNDGTMNSDPVTENVVSLTNDQGALLGNAPRCLFQTRAIEVPKIREKSSLGLVSLSKELRARTQLTKDDGKSSDSDIPFHRLGFKKGAGGAGLRDQEPPKVTRKRKTPMLPFLSETPKNPLDAIDHAPKFKVVHSNHKRRIKKEVTSDCEDDPMESSGAEVKGDSDYALSTDPDEYK